MKHEITVLASKLCRKICFKLKINIAFNTDVSAYLK